MPYSVLFSDKATNKWESYLQSQFHFGKSLPRKMAPFSQEKWEEERRAQTVWRQVAFPQCWEPIRAYFSGLISISSSGRRDSQWSAWQPIWLDYTVPLTKWGWLINIQGQIKQVCWPAIHTSQGWRFSKALYGKLRSAGWPSTAKQVLFSLHRNILTWKKPKMSFKM